jgi:hypothetical protein
MQHFNTLLRNFLLVVQQPYSGLDTHIVQDHTQTHNTRSDSSGQGIRPSQGPLPGNKQQSQKTDIHAHGGIRTLQSQQASGRRPMS